MEASFWKLRDFHFLYLGGTYLPVQPRTSKWRSNSFIYLFGAWCRASHSHEGRCGAYLSLYILGKTSSKHIISQIINCCYDQCYEVVKDIMGVLNRKAGLDWEEQGKFSQGNDLLLR